MIYGFYFALSRLLDRTSNRVVICRVSLGSLGKPEIGEMWFVLVLVWVFVVVGCLCGCFFFFLGGGILTLAERRKE